MHSPGPRWRSANDVARLFCVRSEALFRYSQRGMLGARWDDAHEVWLYDVERIAQLFLHRDQAARSAPGGDTFGELGEVTLGGPTRRRSRATVPPRSTVRRVAAEQLAKSG